MSAYILIIISLLKESDSFAAAVDAHSQHFRLLYAAVMLNECFRLRRTNTLTRTDAWIKTWCELRYAVNMDILVLQNEMTNKQLNGYCLGLGARIMG